MKRKLFRILFPLVILMILLSAKAMAANTIEVDTFEELRAAISGDAATVASGDTVRVVGDFTSPAEDSSITISTNAGFTLDLGEYTVSLAGDTVTTPRIVHSGAGSLTVTGGANGKLISTSEAGCTLLQMDPGSGPVTVSGGALQSGGNGSCVIRNDSESTLTVSGGTVENTGGGNAIYNRGSGAITISEPEGKTTLVQSGSTSPLYCTILNTSGGALTIEGGTVQNTGGGITISNTSGGAITVEGGTVQNAGTANDKHTISNTSSGAITISGGTVQNTGDYGCAIYHSSSGTVNISQSGENPTLVSSAAPISSAAEISAITMKNGDLNISGGTVRSVSTSSSGCAIHYRCNGTVTISGGTVENAGEGSAIFCDGDVTLNISGGLVKSTDGGLAVFNSNTSQLVLNITGGTVEAARDTIFVYHCTLTMTGGAVTSSSTEQNQAALRLYSGTADISGGTVQNTGEGIAIATTGSSTSPTVLRISQSGETQTLVTGKAAGVGSGTILNSGTAEVIISGGTVQNTATGGAIRNKGEGTVTISGGTVQNTSSKDAGEAIFNMEKD